MRLSKSVVDFQVVWYLNRRVRFDGRLQKTKAVLFGENLCETEGEGINKRQSFHQYLNTLWDFLVNSILSPLAGCAYSVSVDTTVAWSPPPPFPPGPFLVIWVKQ